MSLINPSAHRAVLLDIEWIGSFADPAQQNTLFLTSNTEPLTVQGTTYTPEPSIEVSLPKYDGGVENRSAAVRITRQLQLARRLSLGRAHQTVTLRIKQLTWNPLDLTDNTLTTLWQGTVSGAEINPEGKAGAAELTIGPCGGGMDRTVNPICSSRCWKRFGDAKTCTIDRDSTTAPSGASLRQTVRIETINGLTVFVRANTEPSFSSADYWVGGDMNFAGVPIKIREWTAVNPGRFELAEFPPQEFMDNVAAALNSGANTADLDVVIRPGCNRSIQACRRYGNEFNYGGVGLAMPLRNPNLEIGD